LQFKGQPARSGRFVGETDSYLQPKSGVWRSPREMCHVAWAAVVLCSQLPPCHTRSSQRQLRLPRPSDLAMCSGQRSLAGLNCGMEYVAFVEQTTKPRSHRLNTPTCRRADSSQACSLWLMLLNAPDNVTRGTNRCRMPSKRSFQHSNGRGFVATRPLVVRRLFTFSSFRLGGNAHPAGAKSFTSVL
jgi:hypothetical protein